MVNTLTMRANIRIKFRNEMLSNNIKNLRSIIFITLLCYQGIVFTHGGGLDSSGCHHDRKNGGYHCHRSSYTPSPSISSPIYSSPSVTSSKTCRITIGNEYYEFKPGETSKQRIQFKEGNDGEVTITCY